MKINTDKIHLLRPENLKIASVIDTNAIQSENAREILGVLIDSKLTFKSNVNNICKKASQKLNSLARISSYIPVCNYLSKVREKYVEIMLKVVKKQL